MNNDITPNPFEIGTDELERTALEECVRRQRLDRKVLVMVMPAKHCELGIQFARLGAQVVIADKLVYRQDIEGRILSAGLHEEIRYAPCNIPAPPENLSDELFDIIFVHHCLCSAPYEEARRIVRQQLRQLKIGGKLYLSVLGLHSELSEGYAGTDVPVEKRFSELAPDQATKYAIPFPVCLYSERNLFMLLLEAGGSVLRTLTTTYGNVKGVAVRV